MKFKKYFIIISFGIIILFVVVLFAIYNSIKEQTIQEMNINQTIYAQQAVTGIEEYISNIVSTLNFLSRFPEIVDFNASGRQIMMNYQRLSPDEIIGVTRIDARGRILYTFPDIASVGKNVSNQEHINLSMKTHGIVVSDVFTAVQGFRAIAVHVPVWKNNVYDGTLAFLLSFNQIAKKHIENIRIGENGYAWVVSAKGIEISSPIEEHIGKNTYEINKDFPEIISMVDEMLKGKKGVTTYYYNRIRNQSLEKILKHAVYMPITLGNTFWSIVVATPEEDVIASLAGLKTKLLFITIALLTIYVIGLFLIIHFQIVISEQKKREIVLTALKESEAHYRYLFEQNPLPMLIYESGSLNMLSVNDAFMEHYGYSKTEALALHLPDIYPEFEKKAIADLSNRLKGHAYAGEWHHIKKNGTLISIEAHSHGFSFEGRNSRIAVITDITERKRTETELEKYRKHLEEIVQERTSEVRTANDQLEAIFEAATSGIVLIKDRIIVRCNHKMDKLFGYAHGEMIGRTTRNWYTNDATFNIIGAETADCMVNGKMFFREQQLVRKDGSLFWGRMTAQASDNSDKSKGLVGIINDITIERENAEALKNAKERAESADQLKSAFLATMSHELRTPLNSIIGFVGILLQGLAGSLNNEQSKQLGMVQNSANHLLALINDVLDISKIEAGQLQVFLKKYDFRQSIEKIISSVRPLAERKGLKLKTTISPDVHELVSDSRRVEQILLNLLNNAIKFTEKGSVQVECKISDKTLITSITDTGMGIRDEDLEKLFKPFSQVDTGTTRTHEGTGLGLSICKRLVEKLGGTINVQSKFGIGSLFIVEFPMN